MARLKRILSIPYMMVSSHPFFERMIFLCTFFIDNPFQMALSRKYMLTLFIEPWIKGGNCIYGWTLLFLWPKYMFYVCLVKARNLINVKSSSAYKDHD